MSAPSFFLFVLVFFNVECFFFKWKEFILLLLWCLLFIFCFRSVIVCCISWCIILCMVTIIFEITFFLSFLFFIYWIWFLLYETYFSKKSLSSSLFFLFFYILIFYRFFFELIRILRFAFNSCLFFRFYLA